MLKMVHCAMALSRRGTTPRHRVRSVWGMVSRRSKTLIMTSYSKERRSTGMGCKMEKEGVGLKGFQEERTA